MLPKFFDREKELEWLERIYADEGFKLVVLYGRRRVGKTELLKEFLRGKDGIYLLATDESLGENIKSLKEKFAAITHREYFLKLETSSFYDLFKFFSDEVKGERIIVVIDELPYLLSVKKGMLSLFQKIADEILKDSNIMLILCGSAVSIMESDVLGHGTPLYGRNLHYWKLQPFDFKTMLGAFKNIEKCLEAYFVFGGIPYYLKFYNENLGIMENIKINLLTKGRNLYDEPLILLRQEFKESRVYRLILRYISSGYKSIGKLCSACGLDKNNATKYLSTLEELGFVRHIVPLGMKRKGIYEIKDPLFRFWFRFVYPHRDLLELGNTSEVAGKIERDLNSYFGLAFEYVIEEILKTRSMHAFKNFTNVHKWWHKDKEIDLVALNEKSKQILFAECKWQSKVNAERMVKELAEKACYVEWNSGKRKEHYAIFARSFSKRIEEFEGRPVYCIGLRELEREVRKR